ncbi:sister chromatid cohesion protein Eso1 [Cryptosporidium felis]|nr:sister chromatid cohesion protein Eso1 [Cryptosporidium felis]
MFGFKELEQAACLYEEIRKDFLKKYNPAMVPRIISLVDMDAFFAQVCHVKFEVPREKPLAVIHNNLVLAVNYPARQKGVCRGMRRDQIFSICPEIIIPENIFFDGRDRYLDSFEFDDSRGENSSTNHKEYQKFSLDIFRAASRLVFQRLKSYLPTCKSQIASIDEIYFDLTDLVKMMFEVIKISMQKKDQSSSKAVRELGPQMCFQGEINHNIVGDNFDVYIEMLFPELFDSNELKGITDTFYENCKVARKNKDRSVNCSYSNYYEKLGIENVTFQEMCIIFGSILVNRARTRLTLETSYTCSSGIYMNKIFSKMISSLRKPNRQTLLLQRWMDDYLGETDILKLRYLGGKLGKQLIERYPSITKIKDLQKYSLNQLTSNFGERNGGYLFHSSRGIDLDPVEDDSEKNTSSIQSSKIFSNNPLTEISQVENWLKIFSCELYFRNQANFQNLKRKPTKIGVKIRDEDGVIKIRTGNLKYSSDLPSKQTIYNSARSLLFSKFKIARNNKLLFPCKYLGVYLGSFKNIRNDISKIQFNFDFKDDEYLIDAICLEMFGLEEQNFDSNTSLKAESRQELKKELKEDSLDKPNVLASVSANTWTPKSAQFSDQPNYSLPLERKEFIYDNWPFRAPIGVRIQGRSRAHSKRRLEGRGAKIYESSLKPVIHKESLEVKYKQTKLDTLLKVGKND